MRIDRPAELQRSELVPGVRPEPADAHGKDAPAPLSPIARTDRVEISDAGRAMVDQVPESSLSPDRITEIRTHILQGAYDSIDVVDQVARRILESGDLA